MVTDENYIYDVIQSTCIQHRADNLINDFHYIIERINFVKKRFTLQFFNELPDYYDIRWDSSFQEEGAFHEWLTKRIRNYIWSEKMARKILADLSGLPEKADIQNHAQEIIFGTSPITNNMNKKGKSIMATTEGIKITTDRYVSESEAYYDSELKKIETKLQQDISDAQFEAQKARCDLENWFRAEKIKAQETEKAQKRKAYYDGLIASGFTEDQALKILLEEL